MNGNTSLMLGLYLMLIFSLFSWNCDVGSDDGDDDGDNADSEVVCTQQ